MPLSQAAGLREIVSGAVGTPTSVGGRIPAKDGATYPLFTSSKISFPTAGLSSIGGSTPITIAWTQEPRNTAGYNAVFEWRPAGATNPFLIYQSSVEAAYSFVVGARLADGGGVVSTFSSSVGPATNGVLDRYVLTLPSGPSNGSTARLWRNGVEQIKGTSNASNQFGTATTAASSIGQLDGGGDPFEGLLGDFTIWNRVVADAEAIRWGRNPWSLFAPLPRRLWIPVAGGGTTHATTGALTGSGSTTAGTAAHIAVHATSGALTGPGSTTAGTAARVAVHPTSGALTGPGSTTAGTAARLANHQTTGVLTGSGSTTAGVAARTRAHATDGVLTGPGSTTAGAAARSAAGTHDTTGALTGSGSTIAGTAIRLAVHATSGALTGPGSAVVGTAAHIATHATSGALVGTGAQLSGVAQGPGVAVESGAGLGDWAIIARRRQADLDIQLDRQRRAQRAAEEEVEERERALVRAKSEAAREREQVRLAKAVERQAKEARLTELIAEQLVALAAEPPLKQVNAVQSRDNEEEEAILLLLLQ